MPKRKKRSPGSTLKPRGREKKSVAHNRERRRLAFEAKEQQLDDLVLSITSPAPAAEEEERLEEEEQPTARRTLIVNYAEDSDADDDDADVGKEVDAEEYCQVELSETFLSVQSRKNIRLGIALHYEYVLGSPPENEWRKSRTVSTICKVFGQQSRRAFEETVRNTIRDVVYCQEHCLRYSGDGHYESVGRKTIIKEDSVEAEIIADTMENGNSLKMGAYIVNQYRKTNSKPSVTYSAVHGCFKRLQPQLKLIKRGKQGSKDPTDAWSMASHRWFSQLLLRFGKIDFSNKIFREILGEAYDEKNPPACYDITKLTKLKLNQIAWWDEMHRKCSIGASGSQVGRARKNVSISFKRNKEGKLDLKNGLYSEVQQKVVQVKYEKEIRMGFGCFVDASGVGKKIKPFDYSGTRLITRPERHKLRLQFIGFARSKMGNPSQVWIADSRTEGVIYEDECITIIPGLKQKTLEKLQVHGISLVKDLKMLSDDLNRTKEIAKATLGISLQKLLTFVTAAETCLEGNPPVPFDHRTADNPYESLYKDNWELEIDKACMAGKRCITELIDYMFEETQACFGDGVLG